MRPNTTSSCWRRSMPPATTASMYSSAMASAPPPLMPASFASRAWTASRARASSRRSSSRSTGMGAREGLLDTRPAWPGRGRDLSQPNERGARVFVGSDREVIGRTVGRVVRRLVGALLEHGFHQSDLACERFEAGPAGHLVLVGQQDDLR